MDINLQSTDSFTDRHIGPNDEETKEMLKSVGVQSLEQLIDETIPPAIRLNDRLNLDAPMSEHRFLQDLKQKAKKNKVNKSFIGMGYYDCITPSVIRRNVLENPGWYTPYTPYQAEVSQGRLEGLVNFQTMVCDLTGMDIANASLLDEGTAAAEAMSMMYDLKNKRAKDDPAEVFFVSEKCFPQTIEVLRSRANPLGIKLVIGDHNEFEPNENVFGALLQYPNADGAIEDYTPFIEKLHKGGAHIAVAADLLSLTLLTPPGAFGADIVVGSTQRFGVPLGYGGPHAAYFATNNKHKRKVPGRIIGVSIDKHEDQAYRMALQTREQHIRRERATSNICTAQALLANMAGMYAVYHGPEGLKKIAQRIHALTKLLAHELKALGYEQDNPYYFDTLKIPAVDQQSEIKQAAEAAGLNFRYFDDGAIGISMDEAKQPEDISAIARVFAKAKNKTYEAKDYQKLAKQIKFNFPKPLSRKSDYLTHPVFNSFHSETEMMRYLKQLENKDLGLNRSMIPLGSCTMKLNAATELLPITWPEFANMHPFAPKEQAAGYAEIIEELSDILCEITKLDDCSLQPNSGAQGEFTGLSVIQAYHRDRGEEQRKVVLIPESAHGTNPASGSMVGMKVVIVKCDDEGNIDTEDLRKKAEKHSDTLGAIMITYPSTHGVFEENITEICDIVHENGGQVYLDGANMNAQVGYTSPEKIGADVIHLNLHKTFSIPHGGGGPGMGPICTAKHLSPYLPDHPIIKTGGDKAISSVNAAPWGSADILIISYAYFKLLGREGVEKVTQIAILSANYIKEKLKDYYPVLYAGKQGRVAHEYIIDLREMKREIGVDVEDVAKRLIDYGFHAPTMSFPVMNTMMIEPTESEPKGELDRFCEAMIAIYEEVQEVAKGKADKEDNVLKEAPHTQAEVISDQWSHAYSREKAAFPLPYLKANKFWSPVGRVNNPYGDRNLVCTCPPIESYEEEATV